MASNLSTKLEDLCPIVLYGQPLSAQNRLFDTVSIPKASLECKKNAVCFAKNIKKAKLLKENLNFTSEIPAYVSHPAKKSKLLSYPKSTEIPTKKIFLFVLMHCNKSSFSEKSFISFA